MACSETGCAGGEPRAELVAQEVIGQPSILRQPSRQEWADRFARHGLVLLADLRSDLNGENRVVQVSPVLCGTIAGLERGRRVSGPVVAALAAQLETLFVAALRDLVRRHLESAPTELVVDLERLAQQLGCEPNAWEPHHLPAVLDYLPEATPLSLYGRGPNWLYAAVALLAWPEPLYQFDARLGWLAPPVLRLDDPPADAPCRPPCIPGPTIFTWRSHSPRCTWTPPM